MKRSIVLTCLSLAALTAFSQTPTLNYLTEFSTVEGLGVPLALASDSNGGLYYTLFSAPNTNTSRAYYVENPLTDNAPENHILIDDAADTDVIVNRGFTGIDVDGSGNVYLILESGNAATATVRKRGPAPDFPLIEAFGGGIIQGGLRYNAVVVINDDLIALSTFDTVEFWDANDAAPLYTVTGGETYQRDLVYNPTTHDIYLSKNRDVAGAPISSANLLSGGSPDNLEGYTTITNNFIPQGGSGGQFGRNGQLLGYDAQNDWILIPDYSDAQETVTIYNPSDTATPLIEIDGAESPNGPLTSPSDVETMQNTNGDTLVFISDFDTRRILVYTTGSTDVADWVIFE